MRGDFIGGAIVQQKRTSRHKSSWCVYRSLKTLDSATKRAINAGNSNYGYDVKRYQFRYRINVYLKAPLNALCGPMGRVV